MPTLIAVFILHLLVGSILGFCTIAISLQEKYFDQNPPSLTDLDTQHPDYSFSKASEYVDKVITPYHLYVALLNRAKKLFDGWPLFSPLAWLIGTLSSFVFIFRFYWPDLKALPVLILTLLLTAGCAFICHLITPLITFKYPAKRFDTNYTDYYNEYTNGNFSPEFPISNERQIYNNLYMDHYTFLLRVISGLEANCTIAIIIGIVYGLGAFIASVCLS